MSDPCVKRVKRRASISEPDDTRRNGKAWEVGDSGHGQECLRYFAGPE